MSVLRLAITVVTTRSLLTLSFNRRIEVSTVRQSSVVLIDRGQFLVGISVANFGCRRAGTSRETSDRRIDWIQCRLHGVARCRRVVIATGADVLYNLLDV